MCVCVYVRARAWVYVYPAKAKEGVRCGGEGRVKEAQRLRDRLTEKSWKNVESCLVGKSRESANNRKARLCVCVRASLQVCESLFLSVPVMRCAC